MANLKSSKKDIIKSRKNRDRNLTYRSKMKTAIKNARTAITTDAADKNDIVKVTLQIIDKTAAKGVIKKQAAATKKSNLAKLLNTGKVEKKASPKKQTTKAKASQSKPSKKDSEQATE